MPRIRPSGQTFAARLNAILVRGNLRVSDLARWFDRPHPTVNGWVKRNLNPGGGPTDVDNAYILLGTLESFLQRKGKLLPVPVGLSPDERIRHIKRLRTQLLSLKGMKS